MFEFTKKPNSAALAFIIAGSFWFVIGTFYGMFSAIHLMAPEFFNNIPAFVFGRVRPSHVNTVLYGFVVSVLIGVGLFYITDILKRRLWSEPMAWLSFVLWNITVLSGPVTFSVGASQGREYCEYLWLFDVSLVASVSLLIINIIMTIIRRVSDNMFVSVWYFTASFLWIAGSYIIGNVMWNPPEGALPGIMDSIFLWFYAHVLPGLLLTPLAVGAGYYVIPRITKTPIHSYVLSFLGFWALVTFYSHIGGHHLLQAPVPAWLKAMTVVDSILMFIPVLIVIVQWWMTMRNTGGIMWKDPNGRWIATGIVWYLITGFQGSLQSFPEVQKITHFNNWTIGHAHIAVLGFSGFIAMGALWHILPLITGREVFSKRLVSYQFGLVMAGLTGFFLVLTTAGLIQGESWFNGETEYRILPRLGIYMVLRAVFGIFIISGALLGFYNLMKSIYSWDVPKKIELEPTPKVPLI